MKNQRINRILFQPQSLSQTPRRRFINHAFILLFLLFGHSYVSEKKYDFRDFIMLFARKKFASIITQSSTAGAEICSRKCRPSRLKLFAFYSLMILLPGCKVEDLLVNNQQPTPAAPPPYTIEQPKTYTVDAGENGREFDLMVYALTAAFYGKSLIHKRRKAKKLTL